MAYQYFNPGEGPRPTVSEGSGNREQENIWKKIALSSYDFQAGNPPVANDPGVLYYTPEEGNRPLITDTEPVTLKKIANLMYIAAGGT